MKKIASTILLVLVSFCFFSFAYSADKNKEKKSAMDFYDGMLINIYTGMFDFSDHKQRAALIGLQHQNDELFRKSFLGKLSPITGLFYLPDHAALYLYTGVQAEYEFGRLKINPSFAPGFYDSGTTGKDLGHPLEFKTEVQMSYNVTDKSRLGMSYNHISNASLGSKNPGANSYMFNFLKHF